MDATHMFSKIMMSNCNDGYSDNNLSPEEVAELVQIGTTFVNGLLLGVATEKMVANSVALLFSTISKYSEIKNSAPARKVDRLAYLITDQDTYKCQACGETGTLSPKLWKKRRDCPDVFKNPKFCKCCFDLAKGVPRWERGTYLAAHPRPRVGASSQRVLHVAGATTASSNVPGYSSSSAISESQNAQVSSSAASTVVLAANVGSSSSHNVLHDSGSSTAASTASPCARASPQVSSSEAATSVTATSIVSPSARASSSVPGALGAALPSTQAPTTATGSPSSTDETGDIEERGLRDEIEKFPMDGDLSDLGELLSQLGDLLFDKGDTIGAEKVFREGTRRAPQCATCYESLADMLVKRNDYKGAEMALRKGIKNFPKDGDLTDLGELFSNLGDMLDDKGDAIGAEKVFREGTRRAPGSASCFSSLADKLVQRNDLEGAERVLQKGVKLEGAACCFYGLGDLREQQGDLPAAEAAYRKAICLKPNQSTYYVILGRHLEDKCDKPGAEKVYQEALRLFPDFASDYAEWDEDEDVENKKILFTEFPILQELKAIEGAPAEGEEGGGGAIRFAASLTARVSSTASASFANTSGKLTVGSGTGFDEEAVKHDREAMERVEKEDARKLLQWCEKRSQKPK